MYPHQFGLPSSGGAPSGGGAGWQQQAAAAAAAAAAASRNPAAVAASLQQYQNSMYDQNMVAAAAAHSQHLQMLAANHAAAAAAASSGGGTFLAPPQPPQTKAASSAANNSQFAMPAHPMRTSNNRTQQQAQQVSYEQRDEERKQAAMLRRRQEQMRLRQKEREEGLQVRTNLFDEPEKVKEDNSSVASVLGDYHNAQRIINSKSSCIGIDYQPPTPAPVQHVIGDDEQDHHSAGSHSSSRPSSSRPSNGPFAAPPPMSFAASRIQQQQNRSQQQQQQQQIMQQQQQQQQQMRQQGFARQAQIRRPASQSMPRIIEQPPADEDSTDVESILLEMKTMPPPVSAIVTPLITDHEGNNFRNNAPKYIGSVAPFPQRTTPQPTLFNNSTANSPRINSSPRIASSPKLNSPRFGSTLARTSPQLARTSPQLARTSPQLARTSPQLARTSPQLARMSPKTDDADMLWRKKRMIAAQLSPQKRAINAAMSPQAIARSMQQQLNNKKPAPIVPGLRNPRLSEDSDSDDSAKKKSKSTSATPRQTSSITPISKCATPTVKLRTSPVRKPEQQQQQPLSTSDSSSDSSSSEEESKSSSACEAEDKEDKEDRDEWKLGNFLGKSRSTHSPGPNLHPSPKLTQHTPNVNMSPLEEDDITPMLSHTPQPLPDLPDLVPDSHQLLADLGGALSPLDDDEEKEEEKVKQPQRRTSVRPQMRALARKQSNVQESSDEEDLVDAVPTKPHRRPRKTKSKSAPSSKKTSEGARGRPAKQYLSKAILSDSNPDEEEEEPAMDKRTKGKKKSCAKAETSSKRSKARKDSVQEEEKPVQTKTQTSVKKKQLIGKIFAAKQASSAGKGGKGGGGKGGITVERVAADRVKKRVKDGRPTIICQIPLSSLPRQLDYTVNYFKHSKPDSAQQPSTYEDSGQLRRPSSDTRRSRRPSGDSVASSVSSRKSDKKKKKKRKRSQEEENIEKKQDNEEEQEEQERPSKRSRTTGEYYTIADDDAARIRTNDAGESSNNGDWSTHSGSNLMPPPTNNVNNSDHSTRETYLELDLNAYMAQATRLKHEADKEVDRELQQMKYLRAVLYFNLCGIVNEQSSEKQAAFTMYKETLGLIKHVCRPFRNVDLGNFDNKLAVLSLRCQSLLYLKLYKMRRHELKECQKIIGDHIQKATTCSQQNSPFLTLSPTPSPAGSEGSVCSKSSGYTSAGEQRISPGGGVVTPPTPANGAHTGAFCSVPHSVMQKQHQFCSYLSQSHELWEKADMIAHRGHCETFIIRLDRECGPLTLHSSIKELVEYTTKGLDLLAEACKI